MVYNLAYTYILQMTATLVETPEFKKSKTKILKFIILWNWNGHGSKYLEGKWFFNDYWNLQHNFDFCDATLNFITGLTLLRVCLLNYYDFNSATYNVWLCTFIHLQHVGHRYTRVGNVCPGWPVYVVKCLCSRGREWGREGSHSH